MREIKFRVWDKLLKRMFSWEWVHDNFFSRIFDYPNMIPMQFTGLKDKNGKEVYESDIVIGIYNKIGIIQYYALTPRSGFGIQYWDKDSLRWSDEIGLEFEVIGNIYENPEFLNPVK